MDKFERFDKFEKLDRKVEETIREVETMDRRKFYRNSFVCAGIWAANKLETYWGEDPSRVVVDEMVGVWIALLAAPSGNVWYALGAFALFRLFDIFKPLGIRRMESFPGGFGVMMDDILAGIYSFVVLIGVRWLIG